MPRQVAVIERCIVDFRAIGGFVVEHDGWRTRGDSTFTGQDILNHHIGSSGLGYPQALIIGGRSDLLGPLAQSGTAGASGDPTLVPVHVVAAGRANHAGRGVLTSNTRAFGFENQGPPFSPAEYRTMVVWTALHCRHAGIPVSRCWDHKEHAPGRKPDRAGIDPTAFRRDVAACLPDPRRWLGGSPTPKPTPPPPPEGDTDMFLVKATDHPTVYLVTDKNLISVYDQSSYDALRKRLGDVVAVHPNAMENLKAALPVVAPK